MDASPYSSVIIGREEDPNVVTMIPMVTITWWGGPRNHTLSVPEPQNPLNNQFSCCGLAGNSGIYSTRIILLPALLPPSKFLDVAWKL